MNFNQYTKIYFIGIGGIGMSALARYFHAQNKQVAGYDKTQNEQTQELESIGINISFSEKVSTIPENFLDNTQTLVVYTPAVPQQHEQLYYFQNNAYTVLKRAIVLGYITQNTFCFAVAGTHGKTTTTSILAHLLYECKDCIAGFLSGGNENFKTYVINTGTEITVDEDDEFDRTMLALSPNMACITCMEGEYLDIYGEADNLQDSFR